jgi:hypothetical protein
VWRLMICTSGVWSGNDEVGPEHRFESPVTGKRRGSAVSNQERTPVRAKPGEESPLWGESFPDRIEDRSARAHQQLSQNAPPELQETLWQRMIGLEHVRTGPCEVSAPTPAPYTWPQALPADQALPSFLPVVQSSRISTESATGACTSPSQLRNAPSRKGWAELLPISAAGQFPPVLVMARPS